MIPLLAEDGILLLDNGAYTVWKINMKRRKKKKPEIRMDAAYWDRFYDWAIGIAERVPQAVIVVPDVVEGSWIDNMALVEQIPADLNPDRCMPVWHLHEPLEYLEWLITGFGNIAFGSSGLYRTPGSTAWRRRVSLALEYIESLCADPACGQFYPRIHMMRGLGEMQEGEFPFASTDSTNIAQNHCVRLRDYGEGIAEFRRRIEASRFPDPPFARWPLPSYAPHKQEIVPRARPIQFDIFDAA